MAQWLLGTWKSDKQRTMENYYFQGQSLPDAKRETVASFFGHLIYQVSRTTFTVRDSYGPQSGHSSFKYTTASLTDTSITLALHSDSPQTSLTLYRVSAEALFVRAGNNLEYFKRIAA